MVEMNEVLTNWTTPAGGGFVTVLYFDGLGSVADQREAWGQLLGNIDNYLAPSVSYSVATQGRIIDSATGQLAGDWSDSTPRTGTGGMTGAPVADATMLLLRWKSPNIVAGRRIQGRSYIPGLNVGNLSNGNLGSTPASAIQTALTAYGTTGNQHSIWHRPKNGAGGSLHGVGPGGMTVWSELAVLRRRRR